MIRITVELVSARDLSTRVLGVATICNDLKESVATGGKRGAYDATFSKWAPKQGEVWKRARVVGFDRAKRGAWDLLFLALRDAVGYRNREPAS